MRRPLSTLGPPAAVLLAAVLAVGTSAPHRALPMVHPNPNTVPAGVLRNGVLTVGLEAKESLWRFSDDHGPMTIAAFSEVGKEPLEPVHHRRGRGPRASTAS